MSWAKWNDWNSLAKAAKNLAENAQKRIDKVLDIEDDENSGERKTPVDTGRSATSLETLTDKTTLVQPSSATRSHPSSPDFENPSDSSTPHIVAMSEIPEAHTAKIGIDDVPTNRIEVLSDSDGKIVTNEPEFNPDAGEEMPVTSLNACDSEPQSDRISPFDVQSSGNDADGWQTNDIDLLDSSSESSNGPILTEGSGGVSAAISQHDFSSEPCLIASQDVDVNNREMFDLLNSVLNRIEPVSHGAEARDSSLIWNENQTNSTQETKGTAGLDPGVADEPPTTLNSSDKPSADRPIHELFDVGELPSDPLIPDAGSAEHASADGGDPQENLSELPSGNESHSLLTASEECRHDDVETLGAAGDINDTAVDTAANGIDAVEHATDLSAGTESRCIKCSSLEKQYRDADAARQLHLASALKAVDDSQTMLADITVRMVEVETKLDTVDDENKQLVHAYRNLEETHRSYISQQTSNDDSKRQLHEQQQIAEQLRHEGTKLADENFKLQQLIKKIRSKNREHEASDDTLKSTIVELQAQLESAQKLNTDARAEEKRLKADFNFLRASLTKQEKQSAAAAQELQEAKSRNVSLQTALESAFKDIAALEFQHTEQNNKAQESLLANEKAQQADLRRQLDETRQTLDRERHDRVQQVEDAQRKYARAERDLQLAREQHQRELADYQRRVEQAEALKEELQHGSAAAIQPYLRQIDQLQHELSASTLAWTDYEQRLTSKLRGVQQDLADARKREHELSDRCAQLEQRCADSDATAIQKFDAEISDLRRQLNEKLHEIERCKHDANQAKAAHVARDRELQQTVEALERKVLQLQQQSSSVAVEYAANHLPYAATPSLTGFPPAENNHDGILNRQPHVVGLPIQSQVSTFSRASDVLTMNNSAFSVHDYTNVNHSNNYELQQRQQSGPGSTVTNTTTMPLSTSASVANWLLSSPDPSFIDGWSAAAATDSALARTLNTNSNISLPTTTNTADAYAMPGSVLHYKSEIDRLKASNDKLMRDVASASSLAVELNELVGRYAELERSCAVMRTQNETLMQMYGERVEEVNELREDLSEAKVAYRQQLELLTRQLEETRRSRSKASS